MASTVIGRLFADFVSRTDKFTPGAKRVDRQLRGISGRLKQVQMGSRNLSGAFVGLGASVAGLNLGRKILGTGGGFEASMKRVEAITHATTEEMEVMSAKARKLGQTTQFSASQAADSIETLVKNGLQVPQIMNGALDASLSLAGATGSDLAQAADIATDAMLGFNKRAEELGKVVDGITGVTLTSKLGIEEYAAALGSAGGAVGALGVELEDFNAVLSATANAFSNGSDAGTSFKTFVTRLEPQSREAAVMMKKLGLEFFTAEGNIKSMAEVTGELERAFSGLTEQQRISAAQTLFGRNSMRTALALAATGRRRFEELAEAIEKTSALEQARKRLEGWNGMVLRLQSSIEGLLLKIGFEGGLLGVATELGEKLIGLVDTLSTINPEILTMAVNVGAALAGITAVAGTIGVVSTAFAAFVAPVLLVTAKLALFVAAAAAVVAAVAAIGVGLKTLGDFVMPPISEALSWLGSQFKAVFGGILDVVSYVMSALGKFAGYFKLIFSGMLSVVGVVVDKIQSGFEHAVKVAAKSLNFLIDAFNELPEWMRGGLELGRIDVDGISFDPLSEKFKQVFDSTLDSATELGEAIASEISKGYDSLKTEVARELELVTGVTAAYFDKYKENFAAAIGGIEGLAARGGEKIKKLLFEQPASAGAKTLEEKIGEAISNGMKDVNAFLKKMGEANKQTQKNAESMGKFGDSIKESFADGIARARNFGDIVTDVLEDIRYNMVKKLIWSESGGGILNAIGSAFKSGGGFGKIGDFFGNIFGPGKANGGHVLAGKLYPVNERGNMEFFQPSTNGRVIPLGNPGMGGGGVVNHFSIHIDGRGSGPGDIERLAAALPGLIDSRIVPVVRDGMRRGRL